MRSVRVALPLAIMLGLAGSTSAFLQGVRPTHFVVPAHKYQAAVSRPHAQPRVFRNMRLMSSTLETETEPTSEASSQAVEDTEPPIALEEQPAIRVELDESDMENLEDEDEDEDEDRSEDDVVTPVAEQAEPPADDEGDDGDNDDASTGGEIPLSSIVVGEEYEGIINNVVSYGAFVDMGAEINGLVHISQLADEFVSSCEDHVKEGDTVRVRVLNVDPESKKLVLSMRKNQRPASTEQGDLSKYSAILAEDPGKFISATVENIVSYGAFFKMEDGCSGFVHISQLSKTGEHVNSVEDVLSIGQVVDVRIREVDEKLRRINMSLLPLGQGEQNSNAAPAATKDVSHLQGADPQEFRTGSVSAVAPYGLFVNIDGVDGLLHVSKMSVDRSITQENIHEKFNVGDEVQVRIIDVNVTGNKMSLSMVEEAPQMDFTKFEEMSPDEWIEGTVVSMKDYGAFVRLEGGVDGMVHISQLGAQGQRVDTVDSMVAMGQQVRVRVIHADTVNRKLRLTMRESDGDYDRNEYAPPQRRTKNVEPYLDASPDEWISGVVSSIMPFGAFVALDDTVDGLVHISQVSEDHVDNVEDHLAVGQEVQVRVIDVDPHQGRIGLSMREPRLYRGAGRVKKDVSILLDRDPDEFITGTVVSIVPYGAFVNIEGDIDGLVHISEMSMGRVDSVEDVVQLGQEVQVRIAEVNTDNNTVNLSMVPAYDGGRGDGESYGSEQPGRGRGRGRARRDEYSPANDFMDAPRSSGGDDGSARADWQQLLNNYFDDKE